MYTDGNFLGGRDGRSVEQDSYEQPVFYHKLKDKYADKEIDVKTCLKMISMSTPCGKGPKMRS